MTKELLATLQQYLHFNQLKNLMKIVRKDRPIILSVFAGRIADSGRDPEVIMKNVRDF